MSVLRPLGFSNPGMPAVGVALEVDCPVCQVPAGAKCAVSNGERIVLRPPHVERGRNARWSSMFPSETMYPSEKTL
jgi:hypothetical protein